MVSKNILYRSTKYQVSIGYRVALVGGGLLGGGDDLSIFVFRNEEREELVYSKSCIYIHTHTYINSPFSSPT